MKTSSVRLLLVAGVCELLLSALTVSAASLTVSPNLQQFFVGASVALTCEGQVGSVGWMLKSNIGNGTESCEPGGRSFGRLNSSSWLLEVFKPIRGVYWCEDEAGEKSEEANIVVSDRDVILEIPALPVRRGSDVTLRCKKKSGSTVAAYFYFNGRSVRTKSEPSITINMQQSDEGLYWCATDEFGSSPQSSLRVRDPSTTTSNTHTSYPPPPPTAAPPSFFLLPVITIVGSLVLVLLLVVIQLLWKKHTGRHQSAPPSDVTYAEVIIRESANKIPLSQPEGVRSNLRTNTADMHPPVVRHLLSHSGEHGPV